MQVYYIPRAVALLSLVPLAAAVWFSIHLAAADAQFQGHTPESVARAIEIEPRNPEYLALRALQLDYDGADSAPLLERAAALSPLSSAPRIRLGLAAEIRGDNAIAEKWLLQAASIDRQYEPRWTLANFYFRQGNRDAFFRWIHQALEISYGDRRPAFDLCWRMGDANTILSRAIPERREVVAAYLSFLLNAHHEAAAPVAMKLAGFGYAGDRDLLLAACDALIAGNEAERARQLWAALGYGESHGVVNGDFARVPLGHGFDWRWNLLTGVSETLIEQPRRAWRIALDGRQPESCALLTQAVNLQAGERYTLRWESRTSGLASPSGLEWRIGDLRMPVNSNVDGHAATFVAPFDMTNLVLFYQRPLGQPRAEGSIEIANVTIGK
jgi:hypothetical protein